jgi:hypothetical protein
MTDGGAVTVTEEPSAQEIIWKERIKENIELLVSRMKRYLQERDVKNEIRY